MRLLGTSLIRSGAIAAVLSGGASKCLADEPVVPAQHGGVPITHFLSDGSNKFLYDRLGIDLCDVRDFIANNYQKLDFAKAFRNEVGFDAREKYLGKVLEHINPHLLQKSETLGNNTALNAFNKKHNMNFECLSVRGEPREFIFLDKNYFLKSGVGKTKIPRRIAISFEEAVNTRSKDEVVSLLDNKLRQHDLEMQEQHKIWSNPFSFDFPKNKGACMVALVLDPGCEMETDLVYALDVYAGEYGMSPYSLCVGDWHWEEDAINEALKGSQHKDLVNNIQPGTKKSILQNLEKSLRRAINEKKEFFMFHYMAHGSKKGKILADDKEITPEEIACILSKKHNDMPMCGQIKIFLYGGSCYSGQQVRPIANYFRERRHIPVKDLYLLAEADNTGAAIGAETWDEVSLVLDRKVLADRTGPPAYYDGWLVDYGKHLKSKGFELRDEVNTMLWRLRFADVMSKYDEPQDMVGIHYSNNPKAKSPIEQRFTQAPQDSDSLYARLEEFSDMTPGLRWNQYLTDLRRISKLSA